MDFGANKTPVEVIQEVAFWETYFRNIYSSVTVKWYKKPWKEFDFNQLKDIDHSFIVQIIMMSMSINMVLNVEHCQDFGIIRVGLMKQILLVGFSGISDTGQVEDVQMMKEKLIDGKEL